MQHARCVQDAGCCGPGRDRVRGTGRPLGRAPPVTVTAEWSAGRGRTALGLSRPPSWRLGLTPLAATCQHVAGWPCGCPQPLHRWTRGGCLQGARPSSGAVTLGAFLGQPPGRRHCQSPLGRRGHRTLPCSIPQGLLVVLTKEGLFLYTESVSSVAGVVAGVPGTSGVPPSPRRGAFCTAGPAVPAAFRAGVRGGAGARSLSWPGLPLVTEKAWP